MDLPHRDLPEGDVDIIIRPECIILDAPEADDTLEATVVTATYMGSHAEYNLETSVGKLFVVDLHGPSRVHVAGEHIGVRFADRGVLVVRP
ncbi:TOBE domain protein [compost metagenome]